MAHPLIGIHAGLGEIGILAFLWVFIELINPTSHNIHRAKIVALTGTIFIFLSWLAGGFYYINFYGPLVKPIIKEGATPWAHSIFMETKEHVFLFLPFLSIFAYGLIKSYNNKLITQKKIRKNILILCGIIILIGFSMALMGYLVSSGFRIGLEGLI